MSDSDEVLARIVDALDGAGIPFMVTGSCASMFYSGPRSTQDVDLVIDPTVAQLRRFVRSLPPSEYYADSTTAIDALSRRSQFNVIDFATGWKFDLIVRKDRPFSKTEFSRRTEQSFAGRRVPFATAEDVVLSKLEWTKSGGSLRQIEDAAAILELRDDLDMAYLEHWVRELGINDEWQAARRAAGLS